MRISPLSFFIALLQASCLGAQPVSTAPLRLSEVLEEVKANNPELKAARAVSASYKARIGSSYVLKDPVLEFERMNIKYGDNIVTEAGDKTIGITQEIENPYKLRRKKALAGSEAAVYAGVSASRTNEVLARTKAAFYGYFIYGRYEAIYAETAELLKQFSRLAEDRYAAGLGEQSDAIKAQVELSRTLNAQLTVRQEKESAAALLNVLMDRRADAPLPEAEEVRPSSTMSEYSQFEEAAARNNPDIRTAALRAAAAGDRLSLAKADYLPDFALTYRSRRSTDPRMDKVYDLNLGITLPFVWFGGRAAAVKEAEADRALAGAEHRLAVNSAGLEIKETLIKARTSLRLLELYATSVLPQAQEALKVAQASYQGGKGGFLELLDAERTLLDLKLEYYRFTVDYQTRLSELERLTGVNAAEGK